MKAVKLVQVAAFCVACVVPSVAFAGGWTQAEGASYAKIWGTGVYGAAAYGLDGELIETEAFSMTMLSAYGEYGLRPDLTLVAAIQPIGVASFGERRRAYSGRMLAGFRQRLMSNPLQFAVEARLGGAPGFGGDRDMAPQDEAVVFRPTERSYFVEWDLQVGVPIGSIGWFTAGFGPRWASSPDLDPVIQGTAQVGFGPFSGFVFDAHFGLNHTFGAPEVVNVTGATDTRYLGFGLGVSWWLTKSFGISLAGDGAFYAVSNAAAPALQLGVEFRTD